MQCHAYCTVYSICLYLTNPKTVSMCPYWIRVIVNNNHIYCLTSLY